MIALGLTGRGLMGRSDKLQIKAAPWDPFPVVDLADGHSDKLAQKSRWH